MENRWNYTLTGVVHPERATLSLGGPLNINLDSKDPEFIGHAAIHIYANQIIIALSSDRKISDLNTLKNMFYSLCSEIVDAFALYLYVSYEVEIRIISCPQDDTEYVFGADFPGLTPRDLRSEVSKPKLGRVLEATTIDEFIGPSLNDLKNALRYARDTGFYCYRSFECVVNSIKKRNAISDKKKAIEFAGYITNILPECFEYIRKLGGPARHGVRQYITGQERRNCVIISAELLRRYISTLTDYEYSCSNEPTLNLENLNR